jgi:hypothetical protein
VNNSGPTEVCANDHPFQQEQLQHGVLRKFGKAPRDAFQLRKTGARKTWMHSCCARNDPSGETMIARFTGLHSFREPDFSTNVRTCWLMVLR